METPSLDIRSFHPGDESQVVTLWYACDLVRPWNDPHKDIARKLHVQPELFLVAVDDGRIVGTVMAGYEGHRAWINYLAVDPSRQRKGYGRALMEAVEERIRTTGCPKINLQVRQGNEAVIEFYRALGYHIDAAVSMGKRLEHDGPHPNYRPKD